MHVREKKEATLHSMEELCECRRLALLAIPKLLSKLEVQHCNMDQWKLFGYVTGFLASLYGHRLGVFLNMTDGQVTKAVHCPEKGDYLLKVEEHKTNQSFGLAKMLLSSQEYGWLLSSIQMKNRLTAGSAKPKYVFFKTNASPSSLLTRYLQMAWLEMNLRGCPPSPVCGPPWQPLPETGMGKTQRSDTAWPEKAKYANEPKQSPKLTDFKEDSASV
ncbi:hypothetical protein CesoFtcFv8_027799 [Champsocephalus esox]|uniref:Uncharacterized protein n=1 Tax=Champsocephalus esox TaxID=159716 RepID=A0AAN8AZ34_9TELE|nr:hypothetical protein CesoFtcFv8_027799 [Champsocephalus esox]